MYAEKAAQAGLVEAEAPAELEAPPELLEQDAMSSDAVTAVPMSATPRMRARAVMDSPFALRTRAGHPAGCKR